jgi:hypothetical protein
MKFIKENSALIIAFLLSIFVYHIWIFSSTIFTYGDWWYFSNDSLTSVREAYFNLWISDFNLGRVSLSIGQSLSWGAYGFLIQHIGGNYQSALKIVHLFPIIIFTPLGIFFLLKKYIKSNVARLIGVISYTFNTYFLILQTGHLTLMVAYSFLPLILSFFIDALRKRSIFYGINTALVLSVASAYEPRAAYIILFILFLYFIYYLFTELRSLQNYVSIIFHAGFPVLLFVLLNLYWIIGLAFTGSISENELFSRTLFGNEFLNILYAITAFHPFWTGNQPSIFILENIPLYQWLIPIGAILGAYLNRKNSFAMFAFLLGLIGILLTKQSSMPFQDLYLWLYLHVPGFNAYREASKFFSIIVLSYSILLAFLTEYVVSNKIKSNTIASFAYIFISVIFAIFLLNTKPLISGSIKTMFSERNIPPDYLFLNKLLSSENQYSRTLWVPTISRWGLITVNHPVLSLIETMNSDWLKYTVQKNNGEKTEGELMLLFLKSDQFKTLVSDSTIKYIIVPLQDKTNEDNFFQYYFKSRKDYINTLDSLDYLQKKHVGQSNIIIYENTNFLDHIHLSSSSATSTIHSDLVSPTEYKITIDHVKGDTAFIFSDLYNSNWRLRVGAFNWTSSLFDSNYYLSSSAHTTSPSGMNTFHFNTDEVCKVYSCIKNADGTYTMKMTLYFSKQAYVNLALITSAGSLAFSVILVVFLFWRRKI